MSSVGDVITGLGMRRQQYADDTQLYTDVGSKSCSKAAVVKVVGQSREGPVYQKFSLAATVHGPRLFRGGPLVSIQGQVCHPQAPVDFNH